MPAPKHLTKSQIETAMRYTKSIRAAAKYLGCYFYIEIPFTALISNILQLFSVEFSF